MASSGKRKTTMAKLMREAKLRENRMEKDARKRARMLDPVSANPVSHYPDGFGPLTSDPDADPRVSDTSHADEPDAEDADRTPSETGTSR